ncbi:MAG: hypothetical protein KKA05_05590 [Alphaproteobacteria bacterium]|nr:hypothetical protein [Alphaproteobacteria bacterium]MBU0858584.1 hypothetical protein [Alphaproteobacteria bacterium]
MDPQLSEKITLLFAKAATSYPYMKGEAQLGMTNGSGSRFEITAKTPADCAQSLRMLGSEQGLFSRAHHFRAFSPLHMTFDQVMRAPEGEKSHSMRALNFTFRGGEDRAWIWIVGAEGMYRGPTLDETVDILARAGQNWQKVNFLHKENGSHLRLVR